MTYILIVVVILLAIIGYRLRKLTKSGTIAAIVVGSIVSLGLQLHGLLLLLLFFISANMWSVVKREDDVAFQVVEKGDERDAVQVIANGGVATLFALFYYIYPNTLFICGFVASIAAVTADTWASEIGSFSKSKPVHVFKRIKVHPGTSGAITPLGSAAAFVGSFIIVLVAILFWWRTASNSHIMLVVLTVAGFSGNVFDTILGAIVQTTYRCRVCLIETERKTHCAVKTEHINGLKWMNNDMVNVSCALLGAFIGMTAYYFLL